MWRLKSPEGKQYISFTWCPVLMVLNVTQVLGRNDRRDSSWSRLLALTDFRKWRRWGSREKRAQKPFCCLHSNRFLKIGGHENSGWRRSNREHGSCLNKLTALVALKNHSTQRRGRVCYHGNRVKISNELRNSWQTEYKWNYLCCFSFLFFKRKCPWDRTVVDYCSTLHSPSTARCKQTTLVQSTRTSLRRTFCRTGFLNFPSSFWNRYISSVSRIKTVNVVNAGRVYGFLKPVFKNQAWGELTLLGHSR